MERSELIRILVLDSICDDYENIDQIILPEVATSAARLGISVERSEIVDALARLIENGLANAYNFSAVDAVALPGMPTVDVEDYLTTYFYITNKGKEFHLSDESWPFDDEGNPRKLS